MNPLGLRYLNQYGTKQDRLALSIILIVMLVAILGLVGNMSYKDAKDAEAFYCEGVATNLHPDYNGNAAQICPKAEG